MVTQERVKELFDYVDGNLVWRVRAAQRVRGGDVAGSAHHSGYITISISRKSYLAHRLVWLWHRGYLPENQVDHINRNRVDNHIENLREVSQSCNMRNTGNRHNNTSGVKGVCWHIQKRKWTARILFNGKTRNLGRYSDFTEAVCHRLAAEQALGWSGCDENSPAFNYVQSFLNTESKRGRKLWQKA